MATLFQSQYTIAAETEQQELLAERLRTAKTVLLHTIQQEGFELGIRSSSQLSEADFRHFERVNFIAADLDEDALEYLDLFLDRKGYPQQARIHDADLAHLLELDPQSRIAFVQSWLDGILSVWQTLKTKTEEAPIAEASPQIRQAQEAGFNLGLRSSSVLSEQDFWHFDRVQGILPHLDENALNCLWSFLDFKGYPQEQRVTNAALNQQLETDATSRIAFAQSWVNGVLSVWQNTQTQMK